MRPLRIRGRDDLLGKQHDAMLTAFICDVKWYTSHGKLVMCCPSWHLLLSLLLAATVLKITMVEKVSSVRILCREGTFWQIARDMFAQGGRLMFLSDAVHFENLLSPATAATWHCNAVMRMNIAWPAVNIPRGQACKLLWLLTGHFNLLLKSLAQYSSTAVADAAMTPEVWCMRMLTWASCITVLACYLHLLLHPRQKMKIAWKGLQLLSLHLASPAPLPVLLWTTRMGVRSAMKQSWKRWIVVKCFRNFFFAKEVAFLLWAQINQRRFCHRLLLLFYLVLVFQTQIRSFFLAMVHTNIHADFVLVLLWLTFQSDGSLDLLNFGSHITAARMCYFDKQWQAVFIYYQS